MGMLRMFIAISIDKRTKDALRTIQNRLRSYAVKGNFSLIDNFHVTLAFLGQIEAKRAGQALWAIRETEVAPMMLTFDRAGRFRRENGDVWWIGIRKNAGLSALQKNLAENLAQAGFQLEKRPFKPHLTLGRQIVAKISPEDMDVQPINMEVQGIHLMVSQRINNVLTYSEITQ